jgi:hypothetical protein
MDAQILFKFETAATADVIPAKTGIHARTLLPGWIYDNLFELRRDQIGRLICVMRPGLPGYDKDYFELVPAP